MPLITGLVQFENNTTNSLVSLDGNFTTIANAVNGFANAGSPLSSSTTFLTASSVTVSGSTVPANGIYLPAANTLGFASNSLQVGTVNSTGNWVFSAATAGTTLSATGASGATVFSATTAGSFGIGLNVSGPAANGLNALVFQQSGQTQWAIYQAASDNTFRLAATGTDRFTVSTAGDSVSFLASVNSALNLNVLNSNAGTSASASVILTGSVGNLTMTAQGTVAGTAGDIYTSAASTFRITAANNSGVLALCTSSGFNQRLTINGTGNVMVNAPSSGTALTLNGVAATTAFAITGSTSGSALSATTSGSTASIKITDAGGNGANFALVDASSSKTIRSSSGVFQILNNAYSAVLFSLTDAGATTIGTAGQTNQIAGTTNYNDGTTNAEIGWRDLVQNVQTTAYTLVVADRGKRIMMNAVANVTVPTAVFSDGALIGVYNNSGSAISIVQGASTTLRLAGTATTGTRTLAANGLASILCLGGNTFSVQGPGVT